MTPYALAWVAANLSTLGVEAWRDGRRIEPLELSRMALLALFVERSGG